MSFWWIPFFRWTLGAVLPTLPDLPEKFRIFNFFPDFLRAPEFSGFLYFLLNYIWFILNVKNKTFHSATAAYCCVVKNVLSKDNVLINSKYYNLSFFICLVYCTFKFEIDFLLLYWNWNMFLCENDNEWFHYENDIEKLVLGNTNQLLKIFPEFFRIFQKKFPEFSGFWPRNSGFLTMTVGNTILSTF